MAVSTDRRGSEAGQLPVSPTLVQLTAVPEPRDESATRNGSGLSVAVTLRSPALTAPGGRDRRSVQILFFGKHVPCNGWNSARTSVTPTRHPRSLQPGAF